MFPNLNVLENSASTNTLILISFAAIALSHYFIRTKRSNEAFCPVAPLSYIQSVKGLTSKEGPWFLLDLCKKTLSTSYFIRLPITGGGLYILGDVPTIRAILQDRKSDKAMHVYKVFNDVVGQFNVLTRRTDHPRTMPFRQCIFKAFSSQDVDRMNAVCDRYVNNWIKNDLEKYIEEKKSFDPSEEMLNLTFNFIMESAFEYTISNEEKDERVIFLENLQKSLIEFALKQFANPLRVYFTFLIKERMDAYKASEDVKSLCKR